MKEHSKQNILLGHLVAPFIGILTVLLIGSLFILFDKNTDLSQDGPTIEGDDILFIIIFILAFCAYLFQFIIIRPLYNYLGSRKRLKRNVIIRTGFILTVVFALLNLIPLIGTEMNIKSLSIEILINLILWASYFLINSLAYYYINRRTITTANTLEIKHGSVCSS
nr:hypothetical protein [uncultured Carboxylicivirga sp.]